MLHSPRQIKFQIKDADRVRFNRIVVVDITYLNSSKTEVLGPFLHIVLQVLVSMQLHFYLPLTATLFRVLS